MQSVTLWRATVVSFLLVCLTAGCVFAQSFGRNKIQYRDHKWEVLSTPHFDIHYYKGAEPFAVRAGLVLEDGYDMLSYKLKEVLAWRVPVILYSSHNDFLQTNVTTSLLSEGVQAFAEPSRRRIVLPFTSSFKEFAHTAIHELAHVFTFQIVYNRMLDNVFTRNYLFPMPGWIAEGIAEYLSMGWDADADMFIRDAVIHDYLFPLYGVGGFYVYKEGQSVFNYIDETYGKGKVLEILDALAATRSADVALDRTIGLSTRELNEKWSVYLRKHYWPLYPDKVDVEDYGRRLTDHIKDHGYYNTKPVLSPDGETIAFFSDRDGLINIYLMSALDGKILRKLVSGHRSNRFESLHVLTSSVCFSPDGEHVAFIAKSKGHDALFIVGTETGHVENKIEIEASGLSAPSWSPTTNEIILSGTFHGQTDLVLADVDRGSWRRLTHDPADQLTPRFFPDGKRVVFTYFPEITVDVPGEFSAENLEILGNMDFLSPDNVRHGDTYDIYEYNLESGESRPLVASAGDDTSPLVMADGVTLIYTSDVSGVNNLHLNNLETGDDHRFTDVLGGVFTPDVNEATGRITFSAFRKAGWDVFISDDLVGMLDQRYQDNGAPALVHAQGSSPYDAPGSWGYINGIHTDEKDHAAGLGKLDRESKARDDSTAAVALPDSSQAGSPEVVITLDDPIDLDALAPPIKPAKVEDAQGKWSTGDGMGKRRIEGITEEVPGEEIEFKGGKVSSYKTRLSPDFIGQGAGLYFSTGFGFGLSNTIALSDLLGNHRLLFAFNLYRDIENSDFLLTYYFLKKRIDYGFGLFQFKNYFNSRVTSIGESFSNYRLFTERNYGVFALASVPFNKFYRMDLELQAYISDREFYDRVDDPYSTGLIYTKAGRSKRRLIEPSLTFVHDSSFFSYFGPVEGSRWRASVSRGVSFSGDDVSRTTAFVDYRWYKQLFYRNSFAFRVLGAFSEGADPRTFFLGGPLTLRGYDYLEFEGNRIVMGSLEYRYPLIDALIFGWPGRWGFTNIGGTLFYDVGAAWFNDDVHFIKRNVDYLKFKDLKGDYGFGMYFNMGFIMLNFQFAWRTDMRTTGDHQFHFFIGPTF